MLVIWSNTYGRCTAFNSADCKNTRFRIRQQNVICMYIPIFGFLIFAFSLFLLCIMIFKRQLSEIQRRQVQNNILCFHSWNNSTQILKADLRRLSIKPVLISFRIFDLQTPNKHLNLGALMTFARYRILVDYRIYVL